MINSKKKRVMLPGRSEKRVVAVVSFWRIRVYDLLKLREVIGQYKGYSVKFQTLTWLMILYSPVIFIILHWGK